MFFTKRMEDDGMMLMDVGAPSSLAEKEYLERYLVHAGLEKENLEVLKCQKKFKFVPGKVYNATQLYRLPVVVKTEEQKEVFLSMDVAEVEAPVPILCGMDTMEEWDMVLHIKEKMVAVKDSQNEKGFKLRVEKTDGGHLGLRTGRHKEIDTEKSVLMVQNEKEELVRSMKGVKKIHEITNHKSEENMLYTFRNARKLDGDVRKNIKSV